MGALSTRGPSVRRLRRSVHLTDRPFRGEEATRSAPDLPIQRRTSYTQARLSTQFPRIHLAMRVSRELAPLCTPVARSDFTRLVALPRGCFGVITSLEETLVDVEIFGRFVTNVSSHDVERDNAGEICLETRYYPAQDDCARLATTLAATKGTNHTRPAKNERKCLDQITPPLLPPPPLPLPHLLLRCRRRRPPPPLPLLQNRLRHRRRLLSNRHHRARIDR